MSWVGKLKLKLNGISEQNDFSYVMSLSSEQLKALVTDGKSKAEKYAAQQELLRRALTS